MQYNMNFSIFITIRKICQKNSKKRQNMGIEISYANWDRENALPTFKLLMKNAWIYFRIFKLSSS